MSFLKLSIPMLDGSDRHKPVIVESMAIETITPQDIKWQGLVLKGSWIEFKSHREGFAVVEALDQIWDMQFGPVRLWKEMK